MPNNVYIWPLRKQREKLSHSDVHCLSAAPSLRLEEVRRRLLDRIECEDPTVTARHPTAVKLDELTHLVRVRVQGQGSGSGSWLGSGSGVGVGVGL